MEGSLALGKERARYKYTRRSSRHYNGQRERMSDANMKFLLFLLVVAILWIDGCAASTKSTPMAIPIERSYGDDASYQLTGAQANQLQRAMKSLRDSRSAHGEMSSDDPVKLLWIPVPLKGEDSRHKTLPLLPIPISNQIANSESPFKIVIVESGKGKGRAKNEHSIEEIEKIINEAEPTFQQQIETGGKQQYQQHTVQLEPVEQSRPQYRDNSYRQSSTFGQQEISAGAGSADYRSKGSKPIKLTNDYGAKVEVAQTTKMVEGGAYGPKSQSAGDSTTGYVKKPIGRTYGTDEGRAIEGNGYGLKHHSAGSYVHVEVNSYGGRAQNQRGQSGLLASEGPDYPRSPQESNYGGGSADKYGDKRPKAFGKAQIHVTVVENDDPSHHRQSESHGGYGSQQELASDATGDGYGASDVSSSTGNPVETASGGYRSEGYDDTVSSGGYGDQRVSAGYSQEQSQPQISADYGEIPSSHYAGAPKTESYGGQSESAAESYGGRVAFAGSDYSGGRNENYDDGGRKGYDNSERPREPPSVPYRPVLESYSHQEHTQTVHHGTKYRLPPILPVESPPQLPPPVVPNFNYGPQPRPEAENYGPPPKPAPEPQTYAPPSSPPQPQQYNPPPQSYELPAKPEPLNYGQKPVPQNYHPTFNEEPQSYGQPARYEEPQSYGQPARYEEPTKYGAPHEVQSNTYDLPTQTSSYVPPVEIEISGYDSSTQSNNYDPPSEPLTFVARPPEMSSSRPTYGVDDEELDETPNKPPCDESKGGGYVPPPSLPVSGPEPYRVATQGADDFGKYQGEIRGQMTSGDHHENFQTNLNGNYGSEYGQGQRDDSRANAGYGYDESSAKKGKPFYIVIFQKQKVQPQSSHTNNYPDSYH